MDIDNHLTSASDLVFYYHQRTKHQLNAYANGPDSLDWDDQPNPFRRFIDCEIEKLPLPGKELSCLFNDLDKPETIESASLNINNLGLLFELAFGLTAWKQFGPDRWSLRSNPSSGNLHPTEVYLINTDEKLLKPGVYHYVSYDHHFERRNHFNENKNDAAIYIAFSSIHWREAWKYGERCFRYCQHDIGHALASLSYAAACLGWQIELLSEIADIFLENWLGLDRKEDFIAEEHETVDLICRIHTQTKGTELNINFLSESTNSATWYGKANRLSGRHFYRWPILDQISSSTQKPATEKQRIQFTNIDLPTIQQKLAATQVIRQRRSAQHFDNKATSMPILNFHRIMGALLPNNKPPFDAWNDTPEVHIIIFVHNVSELTPGLYLLPRSNSAIPSLQNSISADYKWDLISAPYKLIKLSENQVRKVAKTISCHQAIASDSAFSLAMLAHFNSNIINTPWRYRHLFWECGLIGQIIYLEAEAAKYRATGIGCFFDDTMHAVLGLKDQEWQSLYHFTVGTPIEDQRLQSLPAYDHLLV